MKQISDGFVERFGHFHKVNYLSTLFAKVCKKISKIAELNFLETLYKDDPSKWKKCNCCGQLYLKDNMFFTRSKKTADGLKNRCKQCDKKIRLEKEAMIRGQQDN